MASALGGGRDVGDIRTRIDLRRRSRRRASLRRAVRIVAGLLVVLAVVAVVAWSPLFAARRVDVQGISVLSAGQVIDAAQVPLGRSLARQPITLIEQRVSTLPAVQSVVVQRSWPSAVTIKVTERTLRFQLEDAGSFRWVDAAGVIFNTTAQRQPVPLAQTDAEDRALLRDVGTVLAALPEQLIKLVELVEAPGANHIVLRLGEGRQVVWGSAQRSGEKAEVLAQLLKQQGSVYDVSVPSSPAVR